jgi:FeS assembly protein IscX
MPKSLTWDDAEDIGILLSEAHPELDPLTVRFTDLHKHVLNLEGFTGKSNESNEKLLEAIQMAWYEEWKDEYGDAK